mgnify:CR=1 FL=1
MSRSKLFNAGIVRRYWLQIGRPRIEDINYIEQVSTKEAYIHKSGAWNHLIKAYDKAVMSDKKVVVIDFGVKILSFSKSMKTSQSKRSK